MIRAHGELKHKCDWPGCEYIGRTVATLQSHSAIHSNDFPFACIWPHCDKMFKTRDGMRKHHLVHKGEKNKVCPWPGCQYRCITSGNLNIHINQVHKMSLTRSSQ